MKKKSSIMSMPVSCFWSVVAFCVLGIIIGSIYDFDINVALANKTELGSFFATYGSYFSYCLYPSAGTCLYVGLRAKGDRFRTLSLILLLVGWFMAVYYSNSYNGKAVRALFGYTAGESSPALSVLSWLFWVILYAWVPLLSIHYIIFSSSIQASERKLTIHNQELHKKAGTDLLTGLPNRRALLEVVDEYRKTNPDSQFSIAIADIDFFKRINDTYGHNCGDYSLKKLAKLLLNMAESQYTVCRWGGEEFCFFMPGDEY